jgi:hypothetical protein
MGSAHRPNVEAAEFILQELAPVLPEVEFDLIGGLCGAIRVQVPNNVSLHGVVDSGRKSRILNRWLVGLNPVESGGGSSLKLPDYMAHGLATISTPTGSRGVPVESWDVGVVTELQGFRRCLTEMLGDHVRIARQSANARHCAVTFLAWWTVTAPYRERLAQLTLRG